MNATRRKSGSSGEPPEATTAPDETLSDDDIHERLIEAIVDQRLLPGTKLVEDKLGQAFGVSRTRIRQVLIRLAQEQVVTILPNKGASVAEPTVEQAREVFEARGVVEAVLVRRFIERASAAERKRALKALADCIEAEEAARQAGDQAMALRHSGAFHLLLAEAAGHDTFARFLHKLVSRTSLILMSYAPVERARLTMGQQPPVRWVQACRCDEHRGLLTALRAARPGQPSVDQAVALMTAHLGHIEASLCFNQPAPAQDDVFASLGAAPARAGRGRAPRTPKPG
ncbi:GntR family transcriptional regulator [Aquabacterium sp.]|uniref:GntR family transcriptional regulator n=1 Tax=Aquabacterium sp. TaxID=1872578 RepID=UPI0025C21044|nr:GntR family transcriptional regulator [Aquabacterium sp.]